MVLCNVGKFSKVFCNYKSLLSVVLGAPLLPLFQRRMLITFFHLLGVMKLLVVVALVLTCVIAVSEAHGYGIYGKNGINGYAPNNYYGFGYGKYGTPYGIGYNIGQKGGFYYDEKEQDPSYYYPGKLGSYRYPQYGGGYGFGYNRYGLGYGYKGNPYYDEEEKDPSEEEDPSLYHPRKFQFQYYGRGYGFGNGLRYGGLGGKYPGFGYGKGYKRFYYDEEE